MTEAIRTKTFRVLPAQGLPEEALRELAQAVREMKVLAFPTDTVYGLGCTALIKAALRRIYEIKRRDSMKPLPILIHSVEEARRWAEFTPEAAVLAERFWPGPLTLALTPTREGRLLTFAEYPTLALRVPAHELLRSLIKESAVPWASTSANLSGRPSLTEGPQVSAEFEGRVDYILDGGPCPGGIESTVVDASRGVRLLREGALAREAVEEALELR